MTFSSLFAFPFFLCLCESAYSYSIEKFHNISTETTIPCEDGWYYFEDKCYKIEAYERHEDHVRWEVAKFACLRMGANLASIHSKEENEFISTFVALNAKTGVWIGLERPLSESDFEWTDRSPVDYLNWDDKNPRRDFRSHCVILASDPYKLNHQGKWIDSNCIDLHGYICEKESNQSLKTPNPIVCSSDEGGWKFQNSCYNVITDMETWDNAEKYCKNTFKSHLVTIPDLAHDFFIDKLLLYYKIHPWIGIKTQDEFQQTWTSGSQVEYTNFPESIETIETGSCAMKWRQSLWSTASCEEKRPFVCESSSSSSSRCPRDFKDIGGEFCYYIDKKSQISWYQAQNECIKKGGLLAKISSKDEENLLRNYIQDTDDREQGLHIGLNRLLTQGERYIWSDGSELHYTNWGYRQPNMGEEECVDIIRNDMTWHDYTCISRKGFICQIRKEYFNHEKQLTEEGARKAESTSPAVYICILLAGVVFILLAYISRKWIKIKIDILSTMFARSPSGSAGSNRLSDEKILYRHREERCF